VGGGSGCGRGVSAAATDQRQDIATELQAASTIAEAAEPFRLGRLTTRPAELGEPATGLPDGPGPGDRSTADDPGDADRPAVATADGGPAERDRTAPERAEREAAERARADALARVAAAEAAVRRAEDRHRALSDEVAALEAELDRARERLREATEERDRRAADRSDAVEALRALG
jgi:hypothetical protein